MNSALANILLLIWFLLLVILNPLWVEGAERLSFVGVDGVTKRDFSHVGVFRGAGINLFGIEQMRWSFVEPAPPQNGVHRYKWNLLDRVIRKIEEVDGVSHITIVCSSTWATRVKALGRVASPPEDRHWDDYKAFIQALVERYDHDGYMDMPGLKHAHLHYQIEDEAENFSSWKGTAQEYLKLLMTARDGARIANPNVVIFTFSPNLGDYFDHMNHGEVKKRLKILLSERQTVNDKGARKLRFIETVFKRHDAYDVIAIQYNYHYTGIFGVKSLIRSFSPKPLWAVDAASCTLLGRHQSIAAEYDTSRYPHLTEKEIAAILMNASSSRHEEIKSWWEAERARTAFKKIIHAAALGLDHIFLQFVFDQASQPKIGDMVDINPWNLSGLLEKNGDSRPVVSTIQIFHDKFRDFSKVEDLSRRQGPSEEWVMHYRFKVGRKSIDVVWTDGDKKSYKIGPPEQNRRITRVIETAISRTPSIESLPGGLLEIGTNPIIVEMEG